MKTKSGERVRFEIDLSAMPPLTRKQQADLAALKTLPDDKIDYSDVAPLADSARSEAVRGRFYRPVKQQITARVDADVLIWLKSQGAGYQARINAILRREMLTTLRGKNRA